MVPLLVVGSLLLISVSAESLSKTHVDEERGYELREFALRPPFHSLYSQWDTKDDAVVINNRISLTRNLKSMRGAIWSKQRMQHRDWEATASLRLYGDGGAFKAEGMAIWYVNEPSAGNVFGVHDQFKGLGVFLDTYRNDVNAYDTFPRLSLVLNDGSQTLDWDRDGKNLVIGQCAPSSVVSPENDSRSNKVFRVLIRYYQENVELYYASYEDSVWNHCATVNDVRLPLNYVWGVSASTGDLSDNHEVVVFKVSALESVPHKRPPAIKPEHAKPETVTAAPVESEGHGWGFTVLVFFVVIIVVIGGIFGYINYWQPAIHRKKRFY